MFHFASISDRLQVQSASDYVACIDLPAEESKHPAFKLFGAFLNPSGPSPLGDGSGFSLE